MAVNVYLSVRKWPPSMHFQLVSVSMTKYHRSLVASERYLRPDMPAEVLHYQNQYFARLRACSGHICGKLCVCVL